MATKEPEPLSLVDGSVLDLRGSDGTNDPFTTVWQDRSGNGNDGSLINFDNEGSGGWTGEGLQFDGVDDRVLVPDSPSLRFDTGDFTLEAWFSIPAIESDWKAIFGKGASGINGYGLELYNGSAVASIQTSGGDNQHFETGFIPSINTPTHVVASFKRDADVSVYVNGEFIGSQDITGNSGSVDESINLTIGAHWKVWYFNGTIYLVRVYPKVLTPAEIMQNYLATKNNPGS